MRGLGVDIGGTLTKMCIVDSNAKIISLTSCSTPLSNGYDYLVEYLSAEINKTIKKYSVSRVCIGIAGDVDSYKGILRFAPNLNNWKNKSIKKDFERKLGIEVYVENDANMAIWGGYVVKLKKRYKNVAGFTLGTGVGGGMIIEGKLYKGSTTTAGEFGHMVIHINGKKCSCGNNGCLEAYCSTKAVCEEAKRRLNHHDDITPRDLYLLALKGNEIAREIWYEYGKNLGYGIGNIAMCFNPEVFILTGGLSKASDFFMDGVRDTLKCYGIRKPIDCLKIDVLNKSDIGVIGAGLYSIEKR